MARLTERRLVLDTPAWVPGRLGCRPDRGPSLAGSSCKHYPILTPSKPFIGHGVHVVPQGAQRLKSAARAVGGLSAGGGR
jgi:hypothetical protein